MFLLIVDTIAAVRVMDRRWKRESTGLSLAWLFCVLVTPVGPALGDNIFIPSDHGRLNGDYLSGQTFKLADQTSPTQPSYDHIAARYLKASDESPTTSPQESTKGSFDSGPTELLFNYIFGDDVDYKSAIRWERSTSETGLDHSWDVAVFYNVNYNVLSAGTFLGLNKLDMRIEGIHEVGPHGTQQDPPNNTFARRNPGNGLSLGSKPLKVWDEKIAFKAKHRAHKDDVRHTLSLLVLKDDSIVHLPSPINNPTVFKMISPFGPPALPGTTGDDPNVDPTVHPNTSTVIFHQPIEVARVPDAGRTKALKMNADYASLEIEGTRNVVFSNLSVVSAQDQNGDDVPLGTETELLAVGDTFDNPHSAIFVETDEAGSYELAIPLGEDLNQWSLAKTAATEDAFHLAFAIDDLTLTPTETGYTGSGEVAISLFAEYATAYPSPFLGGLIGQHLAPGTNGFGAFVTLTDNGSGSGGTAVVDLTGYTVNATAAPLLSPAGLAALMGLLAAAGARGVARRYKSRRPV